MRYSWDIERGSSTITISKDGERVISLYIGEAMEIAGREPIMKIINEIERTPWIRNWHEVKNV
jgi:hypothetical protein